MAKIVPPRWSSSALLGYETTKMRSGFGHLDEVNRYVVEDHIRNPRNADPISEYNAEAQIDNPFCGDEVTVQVYIDEDRVAAIYVLGTGCAITQASASIMGELVDGKERSEISDLASIVRQMLSDGEVPSAGDADAIGDAVSLRDVYRFPVRIKCALLAWATLEDAIDSYYG